MRRKRRWLEMPCFAGEQEMKRDLLQVLCGTSQYSVFIRLMLRLKMLTVRKRTKRQIIVSFIKVKKREAPEERRKDCISIPFSIYGVVDVPKGSSSVLTCSRQQGQTGTCSPISQGGLNPKAAAAVCTSAYVVQAGVRYIFCSLAL